MIYDNIIRDACGKEYSTDELINEIQRLDAEKYSFFVGSDSQVIKDSVSFVTCICAYSNGRGGRVFYIKERISKKKFPTLRTRLLTEVYKSIEAAIDIEQYISTEITIHIDVGYDICVSQSSKYKMEFEGLVRAQGYTCESKPYSWASACADRFTKS